MAARLPESLPPLLLEDAQLRPPGFAVDHADYARVRDERRASYDVARVLVDEQHLVKGEFRSLLSGSSVDFDDGAGRYLDLSATGLNNRVHEHYLS